MANDTENSRRKHRRSASDEDDEKSSKRHKHRHHRRHHRHRHSSSKTEEESNPDQEISIPPIAPRRSRLEDDVEEGEILEEDDFGVRDESVVVKEADIEIGEIKGDGSFGKIDEPNTERYSVVELSHTEANLIVKKRAVNISLNPMALEEGKKVGERFNNLYLAKEDTHLEKNPGEENMMLCQTDTGCKLDADVSFPRNEIYESKYADLDGGLKGHSKGEFGQESPELDEREQKKMSSTSKEDSKRMNHPDNGNMEADRNNLGNLKKPQLESTEGKYWDFMPSTSHDRYVDASDRRSRSRSNCHSRGESNSRGTVEEEAESKSSHHRIRDRSMYDDKGMSRMEVDKDRTKEIEWEKYKDREIDEYRRDESEKGSSRDRRREVECNKSKEVDRDRRREKESEVDRDRRREKEREVDRDRRMEKEREVDRDRRMEKEREVDRDRRMGKEREVDRDKRREKERGWSREREVDRDRRVDKGRCWSREREVDRYGRADKERGRSRDEEGNRDRRRERENFRSKDKEVDWDERRDRDRDRKDDKAGYIDRDWERVREMQKDRFRSKESERERQDDRNRNKASDYISSKDKYGNPEHGNFNTFTKQSRHDNKSGQDGARITDIEKHRGVKRNTFVGGEENLMSDQDAEEEDDDNISFRLADQEEEDLNRIKEESRRRRLAILEKYKSQHLENQVEPSLEESGKDKDSTNDSSQSEAAARTIPELVDEADESVADSSFTVEKSPHLNGVAASEKIFAAGGLGEGSPKGEGSDVLFCDDIFGETPAAVRKMGRGDGLRIERNGLHDNWDDADGYYNYRFGEVLDGRYEVTAAHGKGVFSTVVRAKNLKTGSGEPEEVAIKILRSNETMYKAGLEELVILKKLVGADPDDKRHCVRFHSSFKYRNHLCLVFESLHMNLREVLKKFGRNIGLKLTAVRTYAKQLFIALKHLRNCGVLHCDIKPDNMLVNEGKNVLKLCDFGNAMFAGKNEITPYLVSRFYRAPEIILGLPYDHPMDIWSVGCCLYELFTGKVLFPGPSNNDMLRLHMELKGPFPKKMLRKGGFTDQHFDQDLNFHASEEDPVTKKTIKRIIVNIKPKDIGSIIRGSPGEDPKMLANFKDLLDKIFVLDPDKRMTVSQALNHPFITGK